MSPVSCDRLYRADPFLTRFEARLNSIVPLGDGTLAIEMDRTAFYPTGGGQPFDTGSIAGLPVVDVREEDDGRIVHVARAADGRLPRAGDVVEAAIDWARRFDHMQQHSGQHILSRAFVLDADAATRSFHLGESVCTIDLDLAAPGEALMRRAEATANSVIGADAPVQVTLRPAGEVPSAPPVRPGALL